MPGLRTTHGAGWAHLPPAERAPHIETPRTDEPLITASRPPRTLSEGRITPRAGRRARLADWLALLGTGKVHVLGLMPNSSNYTFLAGVRAAGESALAVYKPVRGEAPLSDFPDGSLARREVAAFHLSEALGWHLIPPTVMTERGPHGAGMVQLFVDADFSQHYFTLLAEHRETLARVALFDLCANNADRKAGHCLIDSAGRIWVIDHGLTFHPLPKLRTVIWEFEGEPIPGSWRLELAGLARQLAAVPDDASRGPAGGVQGAVRDLARALSPEELGALIQRLEATSELERFPGPLTRWSYPWPPI